MTHVEEMAQSHPYQMATDESMIIARNVLVSGIETLMDCAQACNACADACLGESDVQDLRRCIRINLDCADICETTAAILSRQTEPDWGLVRNQLQACITACRTCGDECRKHAEHHEHCRICADACSRCEEACNRVLNGLPG